MTSRPEEPQQLKLLVGMLDLIPRKVVTGFAQRQAVCIVLGELGTQGHNEKGSMVGGS